MSSTSRRIWVIRWRWPRGYGVPGRVTSTLLLAQAPVELGSPELLLATGDRALESLAEGVERHPRLAVAHLPQRLLERALAAEVLDPDGLDLVGRGGGVDRGQAFSLERLSVHGGDCIGLGFSVTHRSSSEAPCARTSRVDRAMALYDDIAGIYDPWSRSVTEDIGFYVEEAVGSGGPVVELAVGTGRIAVPIAEAGIRVIGIDQSRGMLSEARAYAGRRGVEALLDLRVGDLRDPPVDERVPLVICPFRSLLHMPSEDEKLAALDAAPECSRPGDGSSSTSSSRAGRTSRRPRGVGSSASPGSSSAPSGDEATRTLTLSVRAGATAATMQLHWLSASRVGTADRRGRARARGASTGGSTAARKTAART